MPKVNFITGLFHSGPYGRLIAKAPNGNRIYKETYKDEVFLTGVDKNKKIIKRVISETTNKYFEKVVSSRHFGAGKSTIFTDKKYMRSDDFNLVFQVVKASDNNKSKETTTTYCFRKVPVKIIPKDLKNIRYEYRYRLKRVHHSGDVYITANKQGNNIILRDDYEKLGLPQSMQNFHTNWREIIKRITNVFSAAQNP